MDCFSAVTALRGQLQPIGTMLLLFSLQTPQAATFADNSFLLEIMTFSGFGRRRPFCLIAVCR